VDFDDVLHSVWLLESLWRGLEWHAFGDDRANAVRDQGHGLLKFLTARANADRPALTVPTMAWLLRTISFMIRSSGSVAGSAGAGMPVRMSRPLGARVSVAANATLATPTAS